MILSFLQEQMNILQIPQQCASEVRCCCSSFIHAWIDIDAAARRYYLLPWHVAGEHEVAVLVLVGDGELASAVGRGGEAAEERVQRVPQLTVAAVGPQVHLPEVWRPVHAHLHVQASSSLLLAPPGPPRLRRRVERVLPVHSHRRPPHHLHPARARRRSRTRTASAQLLAAC
jgi:hypothetical protein